MIIRMAKVEILGPKRLADLVLERLRQCGTLHLSPHDGTAPEAPVPCLADNPEILSRHIYYRDAHDKIQSVLKLLAENGHRKPYLTAPLLLPSLLPLADDHLRHLQELHRDVRQQRRDLSRTREHIELLQTLDPLCERHLSERHLAVVAIKLDSHQALTPLREELSRAFNGEYELFSTPFREHSVAAAILIPNSHLPHLQQLLKRALIPEQMESGSLAEADLADQLQVLRVAAQKYKERIEDLEIQASSFSLRWGPYYLCCEEWLRDRLAICLAQGQVMETALCFVINGWLPRDEVDSLRATLEVQFAGEVTLQELQISNQELDEVPIILSNPLYFKPFEIFTRLLPLPRYTSFDPTPLLGVFFPIFFGMILGDAGYALVLGAFGIFGALTQERHPLLQDVCKVLTVCAGYAALFGLLYGEFFGESGAHLIGLSPLIMKRSGAVIPMLYFTLAVGSFHVLMGLVLGALQAILRKQAKEGLFRLLSLFVVTALLGVGATYIVPSAQQLRQPLFVSIVIAVPALILTGGFLAPLEMLKHIGHIISYTRIMAVGMTSVMLAYVANRLAGAAGSLAAGIAVAFVLHLFNLMLGVFAPTIHSLRLHYVEFFSKFLESGGRKFTPFRRP